MFKGIKKRFTSNRSVRNRRMMSGVRDQGEAASREPPDKGGSKPTSPRQVHPVDQISPVPYARRSLERRNRTIPSGKNSPSASPCGYDRRTDTFCLSPNVEPTSHAYPTTPNICVTGGKIEFITPPGSTLSSNASGIGSGRSSLQSLSPINSPKKESPIRLHHGTANVGSRSQVEISPLKRTTKKRNSPNKVPSTLSPSSRLPVRKDSVQEPQLIKISNETIGLISRTSGSLELKKNHQIHAAKVCRSSTMPEKENSEEEIETLRRENKEVKNKLADLQKEFIKITIPRRAQDSKSCENIMLQQFIQDVNGKKSPDSNIVQEQDSHEEDTKLSQYQDLVERCTNLEVENAQLHVESQIQRQQYEKCLDQVASQVVQAIIVQKTQQEQCEKLTKQVEQLKKKNYSLTSFLAAKGHFQSLNLPPHRRRTHHPLPPLLCSTSTYNSQSLPNTLTKPKETDCDKSNNAPDENISWYNIPVSNSYVNENPDCNYDRTKVLPSNSSSLPQSRTSLRNRILHHQTSADACWYDIVKSLQNGDNPRLNDTHIASDPHNLSSDSSSLDAEEQNMVANQRNGLPDIEDEMSTSSGGEDFHGISICSSLSQSEIEKTSCFPSTSTSKIKQFQPNILSSSSQCTQAQLDLTSRKNSELCVNIKTQSAIQQNLVVNFSIGSPEYKDETDVFTKNLSATTDSNLSSAVKVVDRGASEGITKDEGYSTMSSDVQSEVKDSVNVCTVSTVEEEKVKFLESEGDVIECNQNGTLKNVGSLNRSSVEIEKCNNKNLSLNLNSSFSKSSDKELPQEDSDGLRIIYDEEDNNSDIFFVPICEDKEKYLRHSFNFPFPDEPYHLSRCFSDSYLCKIYFRFPNCIHEENDKVKVSNPSSVLNKNFTLSNADRNNAYHTYLRRACRRESFKRGCSKYIGRPSVSESLKKGLPLNHDVLSHILSSSYSHPRILSPSYSHAEMEDWSLDLSGEDITTPGGTEPSCADSVAAPSYHQSQPSVQEAAFDLEEDHHDFLWNGATYFKAEDHELSWPYHKDQGKAWDLNLVGNNSSSHSMISPKSGCSDQPAAWSSSEQLSCCSDVASKCSTDIENFCDQLCNLPELKRVSFGSSDNGAPESLHSNLKLSEIDSNEDTSEALEDIGVETVFTRDFYRLVKFESSKSLTASSKSLATSEGFLTLEKLKDLESLHDSKTLASVLGFIAEQQKYCKDREIMDENSYVTSNKDTVVDKAADKNISTLLSSHKLSEDSSNFSPDSLECNKKNSDCENVLTSSESLSCLDFAVNFRNKLAGDPSVNLPPRPKRSTSLNLGTRRGFSSKTRGTLPPLQSCSCPPPPPRSSSRSTLPHCPSTIATHPCNLEGDEDIFPPPPVEDPYVEPYHSLPFPTETFPPSIPPHQTPILPRRSSSKGFENEPFNSPPVPKRITSRALPVPPPAPPPVMNVPQRTTSLGNCKKSIQKSNRPRSLLKEAAVSNAIIKTHKHRGSCGDLAPICRNSATLMFELEKMAKAEEDENRGMCSPEATSPNSEIGLGTGWVRLAPVVDLGDAQTRANLLDSMLPSSEACSSETDEDLAKQLQHKELLKAVQRNRRKRKASRHSNDQTRFLGFHQPRPTILGRESLFNRFGEEEEKALLEFEFLKAFPSQSDVQPVDGPRFFGTVEGEQFPNEDQSDSNTECQPHFIDYASQIVSYRPQQLPPKLEDLRSSEPCPQNENYPLSSFPLNACKDKCHIQNRLSSHVEEIPIGKIDKVTQYNSRRKESTGDFLKQSSNFQRDDHAPSPFVSNHQSVPLNCLGNHSSFIPEIKNEIFTSNSRQSKVCTDSFLTSVYNNNAVDPALEDSPQTGCKTNLNYCPLEQTANSFTDQENKVGIDPLIDTRSLCNVKATIEKLNNNNPSSGNLNRCSSSKSKFPISTSINRYASIPNHSSKANPLSTNVAIAKERNFQPKEPLVDPSKISDNLNYASKGFEGKCVRNRTQLSFNKTAPPQKLNSLNNSTFSKRTPKLPGSNLVKKLTSNSPKGGSCNEPKKSIDASLPPKGSASVIKKERPSMLSRLPRSSGGAARKPKLPTIKLGNNRIRKTDNLESFSDRNLCDSGSSEGSERGVARLSISDSCAEVFSYGESGDEVFQKFI